MDLHKYMGAFNKMEYDDSSSVKVKLPNTKSTIIITESADLDSASDFVAKSFQSEDLNQIRRVLVQSSVEEKFIKLLKSKQKHVNTKSLDAATLGLLKEQIKSLSSKGLKLIHPCYGDAADDVRVKSVLVRCPINMVTDDSLPIVTLEVFRTTKEAVSFAISSRSVGLWCENISISFEYINSLSNARQIWLNASHGVIHPNVPFFNGEVLCQDMDLLAMTVANIPGSSVQVTKNVQFTTVFRSNTFQTVVIPFGETFAN